MPPARSPGRFLNTEPPPCWCCCECCSGRCWGHTASTAKGSAPPCASAVRGLHPDCDSTGWTALAAWEGVGGAPLRRSCVARGSAHTPTTPSSHALKSSPFLNPRHPYHLELTSPAHSTPPWLIPDPPTSPRWLLAWTLRRWCTAACEAPARRLRGACEIATGLWRERRRGARRGVCVHLTPCAVRAPHHQEFCPTGHEPSSSIGLESWVCEWFRLPSSIHAS